MTRVTAWRSQTELKVFPGNLDLYLIRDGRPQIMQIISNLGALFRWRSGKEKSDKDGSRYQSEATDCTHHIRTSLT